MTYEAPKHQLDDMLKLLSEAPDGQIDKIITPRFLPLIGKPRAEVAVEMKKILDECAFTALASDFAMQSMDYVWKMALEPAE